MKATKRLTGILLILLCASGMVIAQEHPTFPVIRNFSECMEKALQLKEKYGAKNVLLAFDMDNTLMTSTTDLGSEQWFDWQESLLSQGISPEKAACSLDELLVLQGIFYYLFPMEPTDPGLPRILKRLEDEGFKMLVLTSRGPEFHNATERELKSRLFDFSSAAIPAGTSYSRPFLPYDYNDIAASGYLTKPDIRQFNLSLPAPISYQNGILLTGGQHKGVMLKCILHITGYKPAAIIYVDNKEKQIERVAKAFAGSNIKVTGLRYGGCDKVARDFEKMPEKRKAVLGQWNRIKESILKIFPEAIFSLSSECN